MSDDNFLERWSRLKRQSAQQRQQATPPAEAADERVTEMPAEESTPTAAKADDAQAPFDPASLPPIESIDALSDVRAFLAPGVPAALTRAALRRAWVADPAIRDFVGLSENSWDFTTPGSIPGFEGIGGEDALRRLVAHLTEGGGPPPEAADRPVDESAEVTETSQIEHDALAVHPPDGGDARQLAEADPGLLQPNKNDAASQYSQAEAARAESAEPPRRHGHGRALPE
jgi:Protein of unknown function (DUF3306)